MLCHIIVDHGIPYMGTDALTRHMGGIEYFSRVLSRKPSEEDIARSLWWHYLSKATCPIRPHLFYSVFRRVKGHHTLLHHSSLLKNTCGIQVVLDK